MTLVAGWLRKNKVYLCADTKLTPPDWALNEPREGLKVFFIGTHIAVAYAGSRLAHHVISDCARCISNQGGVEEVLDILQQGRRSLSTSPGNAPDQTPDFLVATCSESPRLYLIDQAGPAREERLLGCIGNHDAASEVMRLLQSRDLEQTNPIYPADVIEQIITDERFEGVGGYPVLACGKRDGFRFVPFMKLVSPRYIPKQEERWTAVNFGTAETGGFGYISITPSYPGRNGHGFYFPQGRLGIFYSADLINERFERLRGNTASAAEFSALVSKDIGYEVVPCGELGGHVRPGLTAR